MRPPAPYSPDPRPSSIRAASTASVSAAECARPAVLAAAGLIALEQSPAKLPADHANARFLAEGLARIPGIHIDPAKVETNIVVFDVSATGHAPADISAGLRRRGVLMNAINERCVRAVTHCDVNRAQCAQALDAIAEILSETPAETQAATIASAKTS